MCFNVRYHGAKQLLEEDNKAVAILRLEKVATMDEPLGKWRFKALRHLVKLYFLTGNYEKMRDRYNSHLNCRNAVTPNQSEKSINKILECVSGSDNWEVLMNLYETTLESLKNGKNERLWFNTNRKLGEALFHVGDYHRLSLILKDLHRICKSSDGSVDLSKETQLLDLYALEIQMHTATKNSKSLKETYQQARKIKNARAHPKIMGIIRECGGKMYMQESLWNEAHTDFFEAFKSYDDAGSPRRIQCLKYLVIANMLMSSTIDPFESQEARPYKTHPEIIAMTDLIQRYQDGDVNGFEDILKRNRNEIMGDAFIRDYIEDLLKNVRTKVLLKILKPYTRVRIDFISTELNIPSCEVEALLVSLILDKKINGQIDQVNQLLEMENESVKARKYTAIRQWSLEIDTLQTNFLKAISIGGPQ